MPTTCNVGATNSVSTFWRYMRYCGWKTGNAVQARTTARDLSEEVGTIIPCWTLGMAKIDGVGPGVVDKGGEMQGELHVFLNASSSPNVCAGSG